MLLYAATIFLSAFLLFQVQPLIAKFILPWFGGSAAVWSAALLFFQLLLLAGYFYAHVLVRYLKPKQQFWTHAGMLALSLATLPIIPRAVKITTGDPTGQILLTLAGSIGLPYLLLSATSPLLQAWYLRTQKGAIPYRLFALSNFGSMIALISYPTLIEPRVGLHPQAVAWSWLFAVFAMACGFAAWKSAALNGASLTINEIASDAPAPNFALFFQWIGLSACASVLLLALTSHLTQNVAPIPLLWVAPLSLYLLSFILCFESDRLYSRIVFLPLLAIALGVFTYGLKIYENNIPIKQLIAALCGGLFVCCMVCHGELARRRPHPRYLTQFYLMVSVGGAVGGLFVALISPRIFHDYLELPIAMVSLLALLTWVFWNATQTVWIQMTIRTALVLATLGLGGYLTSIEVKKDHRYVRSVRNFYGVMHVRDDEADEFGVPAQRVLVHGTIDHGTQLLADHAGRVTTSYFGRTSGVNRAIRTLRHRKGSLRLGILGLGAGVTATLANKGDTLHYYEINPLVLDVATHQFGFLKGCPADKCVYMGDARLLLEAMPSENLDFLAMDAFSSDSVPMHLLTREAYQIYLRHLKPDGVLAVHISNRYLNLRPVVAQAMTEIGWHGRVVEDEGDDEPFYTGTSWTVMTANDDFFKDEIFDSYPRSVVAPLLPQPGFQGWTDDFSNIIRILK